MSEQRYYEDVVEGEEIKPLLKHPDTRQLVMWAGASGDYNPIHYDPDYARRHGLDGIIVHGQLVYCFLGQLMTDWAGDKGSLQKLSGNYRGMNLPCVELACRGKVTRKYIEDGRHLVECNIWVETTEGDKTVSGKAVVTLPSRANR